MEGSNFVHAPLWVRLVAIGVLTVTLVVSLLSVYTYIGADKSDWILVGLSVAQIAASGLVVSLVLFFSVKDVGTTGLQLKADRFLCRTLPRTLSFIDFPQAVRKPWREQRTGLARITRNTNRSPTRIDMQHNAGDNSAFYFIGTRDASLVMRVQVNVGEITVSYYFPADSETERPRLEAELEWAISRYTDINFYKKSWYFSREAFDGKTHASVHLTRDLGMDFLDNERAKLFVAQDIAASTRSLIKDCLARGVATSRQG